MERGSGLSRLKRDLGTLESYAALIGILVGAGIFKVTSNAYQATGSSVLLGHVLLAVMILCTAVPYAVFLSTKLGTVPGGDYSHIRATFRSPAIAFIAAWLKLIAYLGAGAFLATAMADYLLELAARCGIEVAAESGGGVHTAVAAACLLFFYLLNCAGVRWFGRLQVTMCAILGISILVLVVPGLFAIEAHNYRPFFRHGASGFVASLPLLFFAYAGFEAVAHSAGEVKESRSRLPRVFLRGVLATTAIFLAMSVVAFGVLPGPELELSSTPMADVANVYLPAVGAALVSVGAIMAVATSLNATMIVPPRLAMMLANDRMLPAWIGWVHGSTGNPAVGLALTFAISLLLLLSGQVAFALNIAVFALMIVYAVHSAALLALPRQKELLEQVSTTLSPTTRIVAGSISLLTLAALIVWQVTTDIGTVLGTTFAGRLEGGQLTSLELFLLWSVVGLLMYRLGRRYASEPPDA